MGSVSYLLSVDSLASDIDDGHVVRAGKNMIPALWLSCFRANDFQSTSVRVQHIGGDPIFENVSFLIVQKEAAIERAGRFGRRLLEARQIQASTSRSVIEGFPGLLASSPGRLLQLHDLELQGLFTPEENALWIRKVLRYVDDIDSGRIATDDLLRDDGALELFDQATIDLDDWTTTVGWETALVGFKWQFSS